jgi:predicted nucleic acid-binding protein
MIALLDSSVLLDILNRRLDVDHRAKLDDLMAQFKRDRSRVLIPTPALAEVLVWADAAREGYFEILNKSTAFQLASFDSKAALECSILLEDAFTKRERNGITKTKFKFDWQIVAIAISKGVDIVYAEDADLERCCSKAGIRFQRPTELPLPQSAKQRSLDLDATANAANFSAAKPQAARLAESETNEYGR